MKTVIKKWQQLLYRIKIEDIKGKWWEGKINDWDENGISIIISEQDKESVVLFPWTSIYKIERC